MCKDVINEDGGGSRHDYDFLNTMLTLWKKPNVAGIEIVGDILQGIDQHNKLYDTLYAQR